MLKHFAILGGDIKPKILSVYVVYFILGSEMENVIEVSHLHKNYGKFAAVRGISFSVKRGEIFGLLGRNGAGKTTTVGCLQGLRSYDQGSVSVLGLNPVT